MINRSELAKLKTNWYKMAGEANRIGLKPNAFRIFAEFCFCAENFHPSLTHLEKHCHMSRSTINRAIRELKDQRVIRLIKRGTGNAPAQYELLPRTQWKKIERLNTQSVLRNRVKQKEKDLQQWRKKEN